MENKARYECNRVCLNNQLLNHSKRGSFSGMFAV